MPTQESPTMQHQGFVDWMKAIGMLLIVTGHLIGDPFNIFNSVSQPIYTKQLGVAFFVFITGWSLANEKRQGFKVVYNRVFPVYFYGFLFAVLLSSIYFMMGRDINESNYLPFILGLNVLVDYFPANPTTWYIGTYLHLLLFWFFFIRGKEINRRHILIAFVIENVVRCLLLAMNKNMIAYMLLPNWLTVFMLGMYLRNMRDAEWSPKVLLLIAGWAAILALWSSPYNVLVFDKAFPFRNLIAEDAWRLPVQSLLISILYALSTVIVFEFVRRLPKSRIVSFFARNTLLIFIAHMPIIYAFSADIYALFDSVVIRKLVLLLLLYVGIAFISEQIQKAIDVKKVSNKIWSILEVTLFKMWRKTGD